MTPTVLLILFAAFVFKHFLVDFPLQSYKMVMEKGSYGKIGGIQHASLHGFATFAIMLAFTPYAWIFGLIDFVIHYHVDWAKMNLSRQYTPADQKFWFWLGLDQMAHYFTYIIILAMVVL